MKFPAASWKVLIVVNFDPEGGPDTEKSDLR